MLPPRTNHRWFLALCCATAIAWPLPALAQIGIDIDIGDVGVDVDIGGGSGVGVDVDLGGTGLDVDIGGSSGSSGSGTGLGLGPDDGLSLTSAQALTAVRDHRALPLEDILLRAKLLTDGEIIDAQLIAVQDILLYELKVLGKTGDVSELYFYARSGLPVEAN
jgi:hypothetical protein